MVKYLLKSWVDRISAWIVLGGIAYLVTQATYKYQFHFHWHPTGGKNAHS